MSNGETVKAMVTKIDNDYWIKIDNGRYIYANVLLVGYNWKMYGIGAKKYQPDLSQIALNFNTAIHNSKAISEKSNKVTPFVKRIK